MMLRLLSILARARCELFDSQEEFEISQYGIQKSECLYSPTTNLGTVYLDCLSEQKRRDTVHNFDDFVSLDARVVEYVTYFLAPESTLFNVVLDANIESVLSTDFNLESLLANDLDTSYNISLNAELGHSYPIRLLQLIPSGVVPDTNLTFISTDSHQVYLAPQNLALVEFKRDDDNSESVELPVDDLLSDYNHQDNNGTSYSSSRNPQLSNNLMAVPSSQTSDSVDDQSNYDSVMSSSSVDALPTLSTPVPDADPDSVTGSLSSSSSSGLVNVPDAGALMSSSDVESVITDSSSSSSLDTPSAITTTATPGLVPGMDLVDEPQTTTSSLESLVSSSAETTPLTTPSPYPAQSSDSSPTSETTTIEPAPETTIQSPVEPVTTAPEPIPSPETTSQAPIEPPTVPQPVSSSETTTVEPEPEPEPVPSPESTSVDDSVQPDSPSDGTDTQTSTALVQTPIPATVIETIDNSQSVVESVTESTTTTLPAVPLNSGTPNTEEAQAVYSYIFATDDSLTNESVTNKESISSSSSTETYTLESDTNTQSQAVSTPIQDFSVDLNQQSNGENTNTPNVATIVQYRTMNSVITLQYNTIEIQYMTSYLVTTTYSGTDYPRETSTAETSFKYISQYTPSSSVISNNNNNYYNGGSGGNSDGSGREQVLTLPRETHSTKKNAGNKSSLDLTLACSFFFVLLTIFI